MAVRLEIIEERLNRSYSRKADPSDLSMEWRIEYEERAAILEYDGGLSRDEAERQAAREIQDRLKDGFDWLERLRDT